VALARPAPRGADDPAVPAPSGIGLALSPVDRARTRHRKGDRMVPLLLWLLGVPLGLIIVLWLLGVFH